MDSDGVPKLLKLAQSRDLEVMSQAIWALGNIVGESPNTRDLVLDYDVIPQLALAIKVGTLSMLLLIYIYQYINIP